MQTITTNKIVTYWDDNPRNKNQEVVDGIWANMLENGYNHDYPLQVYKFEEDDLFHLTDGHHRYESALAANIQEVPAIITEGTRDEHFEAVQLSNMKHDISIGSVAQMFKPSEKREAVKRLLTLPKYWERSNVWLAEDFRTTDPTIINWRNDTASKILEASNPLNLSEERLAELRTLILKSERVSKDGQIQPVLNCQHKNILIEQRKEKVSEYVFQSVIEEVATEILDDYLEFQSDDDKSTSLPTFINDISDWDDDTIISRYPSKIVPIYFESDKQDWMRDVLTRVELLLQKHIKKSKRYWKGEEEWYTPTHILERVHNVMGGIDLDPASNPIANEYVKADKFFTKEDNGLEQEWYGRVFINPPFTADVINNFTDKLISEYENGNVTEAIILVESSNQPLWFSPLVEKSSACYMHTDRSGRLYYWNPNKDEDQRGQSRGYLFYFGDNIDKFVDEFKTTGIISKVIS